MICYQERWGEDADGNRGQLQWYTELEYSDEPEIIEQLKEQFDGYEYDELPEVAYVTFINPYDEESYEFEVDPRDYL